MLPKFRVWCKNRNEWERDTCYIQQDWTLYQRSKGSERLIPILEKNHVVMQSTGLKDKNGVEIFEGDVCEWHIPDMGRPEPDAMIRYVSVVEYRNGSFNLSGYLFPNVRLIKVIGNIYENPELLEVEG